MMRNHPKTLALTSQRSMLTERLERAGKALYYRRLTNMAPKLLTQRTAHLEEEEELESGGYSEEYKDDISDTTKRSPAKIV